MDGGGRQRASIRLGQRQETPEAPTVSASGPGEAWAPHEFLELSRWPRRKETVKREEARLPFRENEAAFLPRGARNPKSRQDLGRRRPGEDKAPGRLRPGGGGSPLEEMEPGGGAEERGSPGGGQSGSAR